MTSTGGPVPVPVLAKAETLTTADILKISTTPLGKPITVVVDNSTTPFTRFECPMRVVRKSSMMLDSPKNQAE